MKEKSDSKMTSGLGRFREKWERVKRSQRNILRGSTVRTDQSYSDYLTLDRNYVMPASLFNKRLRRTFISEYYQRVPLGWLGY